MAGSRNSAPAAPLRAGSWRNGRAASGRRSSPSGSPVRCRSTTTASGAARTPSSSCSATNSSNGPQAIVVAMSGRSPRRRAASTAARSCRYHTRSSAHPRSALPYRTPALSPLICRFDGELDKTIFDAYIILIAGRTPLCSQRWERGTRYSMAQGPAPTCFSAFTGGQRDNRQLWRCCVWRGVLERRVLFSLSRNGFRNGIPPRRHHRTSPSSGWLADRI